MGVEQIFTKRTISTELTEVDLLSMFILWEDQPKPGATPEKMERMPVKDGTRLHLADKAFSVAGPRTQNAPPTDVKQSPSCTSFRKKLKAHLFKFWFRPTVRILPLFYHFYHATFFIQLYGAAEKGVPH